MMHFAARNDHVAIGVTTDIDRHGVLDASVAIDPERPFATAICGIDLSLIRWLWRLTAK